MKYPNIDETHTFRGLRRLSSSSKAVTDDEKKIYLVLENNRIPIFFSLPINETGASSPAPSVALCCTALQPRCTSLQNFAICETAARP